MDQQPAKSIAIDEAQRQERIRPNQAVIELLRSGRDPAGHSTYS